MIPHSPRFPPLLRIGRILASIAFSTGFAKAAEAPVWHWSHPLPHGNNVADLAFRDGGYVHVTDRGGIYTSTNRLIWDRRISGTDRDLRGVTHLGARLLVTGEAGTVLWSDDGVRFEAGSLTTPTTDWLEGVAASSDRAVAVGDQGAVYTTTDGKAWSRVSGLPFADWLTGVAYGAGVFVAVGDAGLIASSPNGTSWTRWASGTSTDLARVAFGDGRFLAVGRGGLALTSVNGRNWSMDGLPGTTNALLAAVLSPGERLAVGESAFLLRRPPLGWLDQSSDLISPSPVPAWTWAAAVWDGERHLVGGRTGVFVESWRTQVGPLAGQTFWFRNDESPRNLLWDVARFDRTYLAVGDVGTVLSSAGGITWNPEGAPVGSDVVLYGIGGSPDVAVAVGSGGTVLRSVASRIDRRVTNIVAAGGGEMSLITTQRVSLLGVVWEAATPVTTNLLQGVAWVGGRYVLTGAAGTVLTSTDSIAWNRITIPDAGLLSSVTGFREGFVAVGAAGRIYTSPDGAAWTPRVSGTTQWVYRVRSIGDALVAVGQNGTLLVSPDGITWSPRASGSTEFLTDVTRVGRFVYVCGTGGTLLRSTNLDVWEVLSVPSRKSFFALATDGAQVVTVGADGVVLRAIGDPAGTPVTFSAYGRSESNGVPLEGFVFEGSPERQFRIESGPEADSWTTSTEAVLDAAGVAVLGRVAVESARINRTAAGP